MIIQFQIPCTLNTMLDFIRRHNVRDTTVRLLPFIILSSVLIPVVLYLNAKSITLYLTTIKLHDTLETTISDILELLHGLQTKAFLLRNSSNLHRHKLTSQPTTAEIKSKLKRTSETTPTTFGEKFPLPIHQRKFPLPLDQLPDLRIVMDVFLCNLRF
jgi:hypothetical protein